VVINALDAAGAAAGANGLNVTLDAQLVADIKAIASAVKGGLPCYGTRCGGEVSMARSNHKKRCGKCGESGHSIRTCPEMKAVSAARLKEVLAYGKAQSSNT